MYIQAKNKGESGSKAQSYYSAEQARESGTLGTCSLRKVQVLQLFCFNCFIKYKNFSQKVMIELWSYVLVGVVHSKNKVVNVTTNVCHNTHYFCVVMFTTNFVVNVTTLTTK